MVKIEDRPEDRFMSDLYPPAVQAAREELARQISEWTGGPDNAIHLEAILRAYHRGHRG